MGKRALWYSVEQMKEAIGDLKNKLSKEYAKLPDSNMSFDDWWGQLNFNVDFTDQHSWYSDIKDKLRVNDAEPGFVQKCTRRLLKVVPAIVTCICDCIADFPGVQVDGKSDKECVEELLSSVTSSSDLQKVVSWCKDFSKSTVDKGTLRTFLEEHLGSSIIDSSSGVIVFGGTFFSTLILQGAIYGKDWKTSIWESLKNAGVWSASYVSSSIGGFVGSFISSEYGSFALNVTVSCVVLFIFLVVIRFLADSVRKIKPKSVSN